MPEAAFPIALKPATAKVDLHVSQDMHVLAPFLRLAFSALGASCVVTAGRDGQHSEKTRHDDGYCLDLRIWGLQFGETVTGSKAWWKCLVRWVSQLARALAEEVGPWVYLVLEKDHIHLEWAWHGDIPNIKGFVPGKFFYMTDQVRDLVS